MILGIGILLLRIESSLILARLYGKFADDQTVMNVLVHCNALVVLKTCKHKHANSTGCGEECL